MKKILLTIIITGLLINSYSEVEYGYLGGYSNTVEIAEGEVLTLLNRASGTLTFIAATNNPYNQVTWQYYRGNNNTKTGYTYDQRSVVGPVRFTTSDYVPYKITRPSNENNIIVLDDQNSNDVKVVIESSPDGLSWSNVYQSDAGTTGNKVFYRTRVESNGD